MQKKNVLRLLSPFTRLRWQLAASIILAGVAGGLAVGLDADHPAMQLAQPGNFLAGLGVIGGILALASSIAYGHMLQFISSGKAEIYESYHRLKQQLFELDAQLQSAEAEAEWVKEARDLSFRLKVHRLDDLTLFRGWDEFFGPTLERLVKIRETQPWTDQQNELLARLAYCEELSSMLGVASIKMVVSGAPRQPVVKSLALLAAIMLFGAAGYFLIMVAETSWLVIPILTFFATFGSLIFIETGYWVYRDSEELAEELLSPAVAEGEPSSDAEGRVAA